MCRAKIAFFVLCLLAMGSTGFCQEPTIYFAGVEFKLGMNKDTVLNLLEANDRLKIDQHENHGISIWERKPYSDEMDFLGSLWFKNDTLFSADKCWSGFKGTESIDLARDLFSIFANFNDEGKTKALVTAKNTHREPDITQNEIIFSFGNKKIKVTIIESGKHGSLVQIDEILEK